MWRQEEQTSRRPAATSGCYKASGFSSGASQGDPWKKRAVPQFDRGRPVPGPHRNVTSHAPMPHPYKGGSTRSLRGAPSYPVRQDSICSMTSNQYQSPPSTQRAQHKPTPKSGFSPICQQPSNRPFYSAPRFPQQSQAPAGVVPPRNSGVQSSPRWMQPQAAQPAQTRPAAPARQSSVRILTAVIEGMKYWSQFKNKGLFLFEIFATLDSAVTVGSYGSKNFLMRDETNSVQCVFFETEQRLPRLIRGQVHRCVGNYDRSRDILMCVSVRSALPSELTTVHETVRASDAEMRALVRSFREI